MLWYIETYLCATESEATFDKEVEFDVKKVENLMVEKYYLSPIYTL